MRPSLMWTLRAAAAAALLAVAVAPAQARVSWSVDLNLGVPYGPAYGGVGLQFGGGRYWGGHHGGWGGYRGWGPGLVLVAPPLVVPWVVEPAAPVVMAAPPPPPIAVAPSRPDPVIYPRNGQNAQQTEFDRQACNRWATTQQAALSDASVFQRAVEACMDGRGYTLR